MDSLKNRKAPQFSGGAYWICRAEGKEKKLERRDRKGKNFNLYPINIK